MGGRLLRIHGVPVSNTFFTSDQHFGHGRVIEYSNRPFKDADEMDEMLIQNYNAVVRPGDLVYHLGDFSFHKLERTVQIAKRLVGQKYLLFGNHDRRSRKEPKFLSQFVWAKDLAQVDGPDGVKVILCHYAMLTWNHSHHGSWQLHGRSHGSLPVDTRTRRQDVGVDVWGYTPVSIDVLAKEMATREWEPVDHHGTRSFEVQK
jgi:calcineurin-like phosphoesterase family protein